MTLKEFFFMITRYGWGDYSLRSTTFRLLAQYLFPATLYNYYRFLYPSLLKLQQDINTNKIRRTSSENSYLYKATYIKAMRATNPFTMSDMANFGGDYPLEINDHAFAIRKQAYQMILMYGLFPVRMAMNSALCWMKFYISIYDRPSGKVDNCNTIIWRNKKKIEDFCEILQKNNYKWDNVQDQMVKNINMELINQSLLIPNRQKEQEFLEQYASALAKNEVFKNFRSILEQYAANGESRSIEDTMDLLTRESCCKCLLWISKEKPGVKIWFLVDGIDEIINDLHKDMLESKLTSLPVTVWEIATALEHKITNIHYYNSGLKVHKFDKETVNKLIEITKYCKNKEEKND